MFSCICIMSIRLLCICIYVLYLVGILFGNVFTFSVCHSQCPCALLERLGFSSLLPLPLLLGIDSPWMLLGRADRISVEYAKGTGTFREV